MDSFNGVALRDGEAIEDLNFNQRNQLMAVNSFDAMDNLTMSYQPHMLSRSLFTVAQMPQRKKCSAVIKVDQTILEKVPTLSVLEMMRILDARNEDMGLKKQAMLGATSDEPEGVEKLFWELTDGSGQGPAQRFKDYCEQKCVNRRLVI